MKKFFQEPQLEVLAFAVEEIMTVSGKDDDGSIELPDHDWN